MMKKKYLMNGMALLALGLTMGSCSKETGFTEKDAVSHAEKELGVTINSNTDWKMTTEGTANVTVNKDYGETYTVKIYANNPWIDGIGYTLAKGDILSGQTFTASFDYPSAMQSLFVGVTDKNGFTSYAQAAMVDGQLNITFGEETTTRAARRSQSSPECPGINAPYDEAWVANYLTTAKEPNSTNTTHNNNNGYTVEGTGTIINAAKGAASTVLYGGSISDKDLEAFIKKWIVPFFTAKWWGGAWSDINGASDEASAASKVAAEINKAGYNFSDLLDGSPGVQGGYVEDPDWVTNFKITGTWDGQISVAGSEGSSSPGSERTIVVTGTWNITEDQRIGSLGRIIVANGGTVDVASGKKLNMVNQAQLVVLSGGTLTGQGSIEINNGTADGKEAYNGGTIDIATFNNNFGKFYNYGKFLVNEYEAGATESNFYNHGIVAIDHTGTTPNARVFNACQFYVEKDARLRNYEGVSGSSLIVDGQFMPFGSADGTSVPSHVALAAGALVECGSLYNGSSWSGPTSGGYAVLNIVNQIDYLNWVQDSPQTAGYFENNIYVACGNWQNDPGGQGKHEDVDDGSEWGHINYTESRAEYKFWSCAANCRGNNGVTKIVPNASGNNIIYASSDFVKGVSGCTPGFKGDGDPQEETTQINSYAFEDSYNADYDMNDVVVKVQENPDDATKLDFYLMCTGASYDLYVYLTVNGMTYPLFNGAEVHAAMGGTAHMFINTGTPDGKKFDNSQTPAYFSMTKPAGVGNNLATLDVWIQSPQGDIHVATPGQDPHGVVIPSDWKWPKEYQSIKLAYPDFVGFADPSTRSSYLDWYKNPDTSLIYQ